MRVAWESTGSASRRTEECGHEQLLRLEDPRHVLQSASEDRMMPSGVLKCG